MTEERARIQAKPLPAAAQQLLASSQGTNESADINVDIYPGKVTTWAGDGTIATVNGNGLNASFNDMGGVTVVGGPQGFAYVATKGAVRAVDLETKDVTILAGDPTQYGSVDSTNPAAVRFNNLNNIDSDGTYLYVAESTGRIRKVEIATGATQTDRNVPHQRAGLAFPYGGGWLPLRITRWELQHRPDPTERRVPGTAVAQHREHRWRDQVDFGREWASR